MLTLACLTAHVSPDFDHIYTFADIFFQYTIIIAFDWKLKYKKSFFLDYIDFVLYGSLIIYILWNIQNLKLIVC